eukprot:CAMPEP_0114284502 /NCGR_PEP_ID=MMETSP0059-20121206/4682_1 /TAXON_ID=36894 /ORGANISM="Pyramimonas parkeae, Strain CCMP726" /LENGTH=344 /DNA_ID=CAMNT_0001405327 /DNA_START=304 /DNA_END=1338 /DNA_ORIENTATION=+
MTARATRVDQEAMLHLTVVMLLFGHGNGIHDGDPFPGVTTLTLHNCAHDMVANCGTSDASCMHEQTEYWGDVMLAGEDHFTSTAELCCQACSKTRGCNTFVWCSSPSSPCANQCWLKWQPNPRKPEVRSHGSGTVWTSGTLLPKFFGPNVDATDGAFSSSIRQNNARMIEKVSLHTPYGNITVRLRRDWAPESVRYVSTLAVQDACTVACNFYRAEVVPDGWGVDGFWGPPYALLQGGLRGVPGIVPPNQGETGDYMHSSTYPPVMKRGMLAWAGGGKGPDFFIATASHDEWGLGHTVWGEVDDETSLHVVDAVVALPTRTQPGTVTTTPLLRPVTFTVTAIVD